MKNGFIKFFIFLLMVITFGVVNVNAADSITTSVNGDLLTANFYSQYSAITNMKINNSNSYSSSVAFSSWGGVSEGLKSGVGGTGTVSLKNGTYYVWAFLGSSHYPGGENTGKEVKITNSCTNESKTNMTGEFTVERCYYKKEGSKETIMDSKTTTFSCADGYTYDSSAVSIKTNTCTNMALNGLSKRYCKVVFNVKCYKKGNSGGESDEDDKPIVSAPSLTALSISSGTLSPSFKSGTKTYTATVDANVSSIKVSATAASGSSLVSGYGTRTVNLNYGANKVQVKVKNSAGTTKTYTITITRKDNRSTVNTLSNLTVGSGTLSPAFSSSVNSYTVDVDNSVSSITIDATLTDNKSSFVSGYGPSSSALEPGVNKLYIKVKSESGVVNVYDITVNRATTPSKCTTDTTSLALLKGIEFSVDMPGIEIDQIEEFDPNTFVYAGIKVPYKVSNLIISPYVQEDGDTYEITGNDDLEVNVPAEISIKVTSKECPGYYNVYTLNVTRQPEIVPSDNPELENITIENYDFEFEPNKEDYKLTLKKNDTSLVINYTPVDEATECVIEGNKDLAYGSVIEIKCTSEDGENTAKYTITIDGVEKGTNMFLIVILIIIIILILIYLVLRLLGYKIYFNTAAIGAFFRGIGEKIKNMFDK